MREEKGPGSIGSGVKHADRHVVVVTVEATFGSRTRAAPFRSVSDGSVSKSPAFTVDYPKLP